MWTVADRCRKARETAGYEQGELARLMGVSRETVSNYERGRTKPQMIILNAWSLATGVSRQWLLDGTIPPDGPLAQLAELRTFNPKGAERACKRVMRPLLVKSTPTAA
jgi:transcriptional regulator with XRE-family HTH domain